MSQRMFYVCLVLGLMFIAADGQRLCRWLWFGENCALMCHCNQSQCSQLGECPLNVCKFGYFGPACQYRNLAVPNAANPSYLTDNDEDTCNPDRQSKLLTFELAENTRFFWLRLILRRSESSREINVRLNDKDSCPRFRQLRHNIPQTVDVMCDAKVLVKSIVITGTLVRSICSLEYGAGRNAALLQATEQISTYISATPSSLAVDGDTGPSSCARTMPEPGGAYWSVTFTRPYVLYNVRIFFMYESNQRDGIFTLKTFSEDSSTVEEYRDYDPHLNTTVDLTMHSVFPAKGLRIQGMANVQPSRGLTLCEVQAFGVQVCPEGFYGLFCRNICSCNPYDLCDTITGACSEGCPAGFYGFQCTQVCPRHCHTGRCNIHSGTCRSCAAGYVGDKCNIPCFDGTYGVNCTQTCPQICGERHCDHVDGNCYKCNPNFVRPSCTVCIDGRYGYDCAETCPANCAGNLCNNITGDCFRCNELFQGAKCQACIEGRYAHDCTQGCPANCAGNVCNMVTGACFRCKEHFQGDSCQDTKTTDTPSDTKKTDKHSDVLFQVPWLYIVGGIVFLLLLILLFIIILWKKEPAPKPVEERKKSVAADVLPVEEELVEDAEEGDSDSEGSSRV